MSAAPAAARELARRREEFLERVALRAYELFEERGRLHGYHEQDWLRAERELSRSAHAAWTEESRGIRLFVEIPGIASEDVVVGHGDGWLFVEARHRPQSAAALLGHELVGRNTELFLPLPAGVTPEAAVSELANGLLEVFLPFTSIARPVAVMPAAKPASPAKTAARSRVKKAASAAAAAEEAAPKSAAKSTASRARKKPGTAAAEKPAKKK